MKSKKFVSLLLAACLSLSAMTVNAWAENGGENKEVPAPVVQEVEGEDKKDQETNESENKETNKDETKETDKDENKAGEGEDKKNEETKPADPSAAVAYGTAAVAMALNNGNSNPPVDNEPFSESTVTVVKHIKSLPDKPLTNEDFVKIMEQLERNPLTISFNNEKFEAAQDKRAADGWKWERPFNGTVNENSVTETGNEVEGYDIASYIIDVKKETSTSTTVTVVNYYTKKEVTPTGNFTIVKVDKDDTTKKLAGATFILNSTEAGHALIQKATTNANGEAEFKEIPAGEYLLTEIQAPEDYQNPNEFHTVRVTENNGKFEVSIASLILNSTEAGHALIQKATTNANGEAEFKEIPAGEYLLTEIQAPEDYQNPNEFHTVRVTENNGKFEVSIASLRNLDESGGYVFQITNTKKQTAGNFTIVKVDKEVTTKKLTGAQFTLTALNENGEPASEPDYEKTTDANGEAKFENVPLGKYILKETVAPQGYQLPVDVTYEVVADERGVYIEGGELMFDGINFYIPNTQLPTPTTGNFTITKVDADNHDLKLTGAQFTLKKDGYVQTRTSDQGIAAFYNVPVGTYTLTETVAPQGYVKPNETYTVKVNENGKISVWKVTAPSEGGLIVPLPDNFINQNPDGNVEVKDKNFVVENTKEAPGTTSYTFMKHGVVTTVDSNGRTIRTTESPLAGAEFTLYDGEENKLQTVRSAVDGSVTFSNLIDGGYYIIKETKAPSGYTGWNGRIKLSVHFDEQGKPEIGVLVEYLSEDREENITGELTVRNYTTVKETEHPVDNRPNGPTYRYDDDDDYVLPTVTRKDNKKPERAPRVEEVIPSKRNPETGSSSSMPIAMAAAAVSLTGLVVLCKKKDK